MVLYFIYFCVTILYLLLWYYTIFTSVECTSQWSSLHTTSSIKRVCVRVCDEVGQKEVEQHHRGFWVMESRPAVICRRSQILINWLTPSLLLKTCEPVCVSVSEREIWSWFHLSHRTSCTNRPSSVDSSWRHLPLDPTQCQLHQRWWTNHWERGDILIPNWFKFWWFFIKVLVQKLGEVLCVLCLWVLQIRLLLHNVPGN